MSPILTRMIGAGSAGSGFGFGRRRGGGVVDKPIIITMWGAGGGGYIRKSDPSWGPPSASGDVGGAMITSTTLSNLGLTSGSQLYIYVGGGGNMPGPGGPNGGHPGGGGSGSGGYGGGGGGMSSIYKSGSYSTGTLLLIAGGGAGGFHSFKISDLIADIPSPYPGATGGNQSSGGQGGPGVSGGGPGSSGSQFTGGGAGTHGGGGGAGYYGGGGGPGDGGAANGGGGGSGSSYINPTFFSIDPLGTNLINGTIIANMYKAFPAPYNSPFNPGGNSSWPYVPYPYPGPMAPYARGAGNTASDPIPGQNRLHPLYNTPYCGGTTSGGNGYPGSVHITIDGSTTSYTSTGSYIFTVP